MNFDTAARRYVRVDDLVTLLQKRDPAYVASVLIPRRNRRWRAFAMKMSPGISDDDLQQIVALLAEGRGS